MQSSDTSQIGPYPTKCLPARNPPHFICLPFVRHNTTVLEVAEMAKTAWGFWGFGIADSSQTWTADDTL